MTPSPFAPFCSIHFPISTPQSFPGLSKVEEMEEKVAKKNGMLLGLIYIGDITAA